jgi:seryl-tRNA synthetase
MNTTIMELVVEQVVSRSKRLRQLKNSLNELATSVTELARALNGLAKLVDKHAEHLKIQATLNHENRELLEKATTQAKTNADVLQALQQYMGVSVVLDDDSEEAAPDEDEVIPPRGMFAIGETEQGGTN